MLLNEYIILALVSVICTGYKVFKNKNNLNTNSIIAEILLGFIISMFVVPAVIETKTLTFTQGIFVASVFVVFSSKLVKMGEKYFNDKNK